MQPAQVTHRFDAFVWLQDDEAEAALCKRLEELPVRRCIPRHAALKQGWLPASESPDESSAIIRDHPPARYGRAWVVGVSENTLRMLHKFRGVEQLRVRAPITVAALEDGTASHEWILRIRPDLELLAPLLFPPPAVDAVYAPWRCDDLELISDQLLLLPASAAAGRLSTLYDPETLLKTAQRSTRHPPSLYPERLVYHALHGLTLRPWPGPGDATLRLVGSAGEARDAYAKLKKDFPACFAAGR